MANNYTVSTTTTQPQPATVGWLDDSSVFPPQAGFKLIITPDSGYIIKSEEFTINGSSFVPSTTLNSHTQSPSKWEHTDQIYTSGVYKVVFEDTTNPTNDPGWVADETNQIFVWIYFGHADGVSYNPATTTTIDIDIDGIARNIVGSAVVNFQLNDYVLETSLCLPATWPREPTMDSESFSCSYFQSGNMVDGFHYIENFNIWPASIIPQGSLITSSVSSLPYTGYNLPGATPASIYDVNAWGGATPTAKVKEMEASDVPTNTWITVYKKIFWTGPGVAYKIKPYTTLQDTSDVSFNLIETTDNHEVTALVLNVATGAGNAIRYELDSTLGIIPGMIVSTTGSQSITATTYSYPFSVDVRVSQVNHVNNEVLLSEGQGSGLVGQQLHFSCDDENGNVISKQFEIQAYVSDTAPAILSDVDVFWYFETMDIAPTESTATTTNITGFNI